MAILPSTIKITDTDLFHDIVALLKELAEKDPYIYQRIAEIMNRHSTEHIYTVEEE